MQSISRKRALVTRALYHHEAQIMERIPGMVREYSQKQLQKQLDLLWAYSKYYTRRPKPILRFGPGARHGRYHLSYTQDIEHGQVIEMAPGGRNLYVLVHELSHALGPSEHGVRFAQVYHDLLNHKTFKKMMQTPAGKQFLEYLRVEHPRHIRRIYRNR